MPLDREEVLKELKEKKKEIKEFESNRRNQIGSFSNKIKETDEEELSELTGFCGAKPLENGDFVKEFNPSDLDKWLVDSLDKKIVSGVDGSQISPEKDFDVPIGLADAVLIENNYRRKEVNREKEISVVTPDDFGLEGAYSFSNDIVNAERDKLEREVSIDFLKKDIDEGFLLLDGALVLSHINKMKKDLRNKYLDKIKSLLEKSFEYRVPVIGFVETSYSRDLIQMLDSADVKEKEDEVYDSLIVKELLGDGDRTKVFSCHRDDKSRVNQKAVLAGYGDFQNRICFFYLNLGGDTCCRVELPKWCFEEDVVDEVADVVRAEAIKGNGYPLILNKAHKEAVVSYREKETFKNMIRDISKGNIGLKKTKKNWGRSNVHW